MADQIKQTGSGELMSMFGLNFDGAQERGSLLFSRTQDVMAKTARAMWECQADFVRLETEQAAKAIVPMASVSDPAAAMTAFAEQWRDNSEKMIDRMRAMNDLVRNCHWQLFKIAADSFVRTNAASDPKAS